MQFQLYMLIILERKLLNCQLNIQTANQNSPEQRVGDQLPPNWTSHSSARSVSFWSTPVVDDLPATNRTICDTWCNMSFGLGIKYVMWDYLERRYGIWCDMWFCLELICGIVKDFALGVYSNTAITDYTCTRQLIPSSVFVNYITILQ